MKILGPIIIKQNPQNPGEEQRNIALRNTLLKASGKNVLPFSGENITTSGEVPKGFEDAVKHKDLKEVVKNGSKKPKRKRSRRK